MQRYRTSIQQAGLWLYAGKHLFETMICRIMKIKVIPEIESSRKLGSGTSSLGILVASISGFTWENSNLGFYFF